MSANQRDEVIVAKILEAARDIFSRYGLKKSTMDDVAKATGKGKSTLYYYFPGKTELFEAVARDEFNKYVKKIREAINQSVTPRDKLKALLVERMELKKQVQNLWQVIEADVFDNFETLCALRVEFEAALVGFVKETITGGIQLGEFKNLSEEEIDFFSNWVIAGFNGLALPIATSYKLKESNQFCERIIDFILYGIKR